MQFSVSTLLTLTLSTMATLSSATPYHGQYAYGLPPVNATIPTGTGIVYPTAGYAYPTGAAPTGAYGYGHPTGTGAAKPSGTGSSYASPVPYVSGAESSSLLRRGDMAALGLVVIAGVFVGCV